MAKFDFVVLKDLRRNPVLIAFLVLIVLLPIVVFTVAAPAKTGTRVMCTYNHIIKDNTRTILVWRWTVGDYKVTTKTTICAKHKRLEALYLKARRAADKKDYKTARKILAQIKTSDPAFQIGNIAALEAEIYPGGTPPGATPGTTPGTNPDGSTPNYSGALSGLFPASLAGYTQVVDSPGTLSASRAYTADANAHPNVALLTIQFTRAGTAATVENYVNKEVKTYYSANAKTLKIKGQNAYFGTDGADLAILAYSVSGVVVELEMSAVDGKGAGLYDTLINLSKSVP